MEYTVIDYEIICCGDIVGYGPDPEECVRSVRANKIMTVAGNHDRAALGLLDTSWFNQDARRALEWTAGQLSEESRVFLADLPLNPEFPDFQVVHGSLLRPLEEYVETPAQADANFKAMRTPLMFVGHRHFPMYFSRKGGRTTGAPARAGEVLALADGQKTIVNPGGLGQPRDGDPRAAFGTYDQGKQTFTFGRVDYNVRQVQGKMLAFGLPKQLIVRLSDGV